MSDIITKYVDYTYFDEPDRSNGGTILICSEEIMETIIEGTHPEYDDHDILYYCRDEDDYRTLFNRNPANNPADFYIEEN